MSNSLYSKALPLTLAAAVLATTAIPASAMTIYREIFPKGFVTSNVEDQLEEQGWFGGHSGDPFGSNPVHLEGALGGGTNGGAELTPVNSNPIGAHPPSQFAFFSEQVTSKAFLYTTEYVFNSSKAGQLDFTWESWNSANTGSGLTPGGGFFDLGTEEGANVHLAFRVDEGADKCWYVSSNGFLNAGSGLEGRTQRIGALDYYKFDSDCTGAILPGDSATTFDTTTALPAGTVDAFGFFVARSGDTFRVDNVELNMVPVPAALPLLLGGFGTLAYAARRQRKSKA